MDLLSKLIGEIFDYELTTLKTQLESKEFISKQIRLLNNELELKTFLGRKRFTNVLLIVKKEKLRIETDSSNSDKSCVVIEISENFETFKHYLK